MQKTLSAKTRRELRKKFHAAESSDLKMTVTDNAASFIDELYPLYLQTYERSNFHFEKLTKDYFRRLGCEMSDKTRFFIWYRGNTLIAFALCMVEGDEFFAEYIGPLSLHFTRRDQLGDDPWLQAIPQQRAELRS